MDTSVRTAILKGANEPQNVGDLMMRHIAKKLINSLGFEIVYEMGHGYESTKLSSYDESIDAIFILGVLQYSDAWRTPTLLERLEKSIYFHRHFPKAQVIFLPSTWGAFESQHEDALERLVTGAKVLARDKFSADNINGLLGLPIADYSPDLAFLYPTANVDLAQPLLEQMFDDPTKPLLGIIPNRRCIEKGVTPLQSPEDYMDFLVRSKDWAVNQGFNVLGISHMINTDRDLRFIHELGINYIPTNNPNLIRAIIANLTVCICSRYHGIVSCLSHGIPTLALGWHHKYRNLMNDMGMGAHHLSVEELPRNPWPFLNNLYEGHEGTRKMIVHNITVAQQIIKTKIESLKVL